MTDVIPLIPEAPERRQGQLCTARYVKDSAGTCANTL